MNAALLRGVKRASQQLDQQRNFWQALFAFGPDEAERQAGGGVAGQ